MIFSNLNNKYQLSKTLRFELKPVGATLENMTKKEFIKKDEHRAESYQKVKSIIDEFHKYFINLALKNVALKRLNDYFELYKKENKTDAEKESFNKIKQDLRNQIVDNFKNNSDAKVSEIFENLFEKKLFTKYLLEWSPDEESVKLIQEFSKFVTYFKGFNDNRKNMYSPEPKATSIAFRVIDQNLPKFIDNILIFSKAKSAISEIDKINSELQLELNGFRLEDFFNLDYFSYVLNQSGIDAYNVIIGGKVLSDQTKIKGVNEYINLYNQIQTEKRNKIPKLKPLFKQILSDRESHSFLPEQFENEFAMLKAIQSFYQDILLKKITNGVVIDEIKVLLNGIDEYNHEQIFLKNDLNLTKVSQNIFGRWDYVKLALENYFCLRNQGKRNKKWEKDRDNFLKKDFYSITLLELALTEMKKNESNEDLLKNLNSHQNLLQKYLKSFGGFSKSEYCLNKNIKNSFIKLENLINDANNGVESVNKLNNNSELIKQFLDSVLELLHFIKPLKVDDDIGQKDELFYSRFEELFAELNKITPLYNKVRSFLTKKPYSLEKFKVNFENSSLLSGWGTEYGTKESLLFIKDDNYYLAIVDEKLSQSECAFLENDVKSSIFHRVLYDFQKPDNKQIPRLFIRSKGERFSPAVEKYNLPINKVIDIYDNGKFKTDYRKIDELEFKKSLTTLIEYFKLGLTSHEDFKHYQFNWRSSNEYEDIGQFYQDTMGSCYQLKFVAVDYNFLMELVTKGKIYFFQIYNKDFSPNSKGTPNMHTLYWRALFEKENLNNVKFKLNGEAEIFFRKKSISPNKMIIHKANLPIENKKMNTNKAKSQFVYDIVKNKRFTLDKFQFHVPITLNFKADGRTDLNEEVNLILKNNSDVHIIGLDRGERHLLYLSVIDQQGKVVEQFSLNEITNEYKSLQFKTNYHNLLAIKEGQRAEARRDWGTIENIKELKEGYLSQVIHRICALVLKYNAIVVLEDLNSGFKNSRIKVEKQIYQKFEKMLIEKLNYLAFKRPEGNQPGIYKALQLTNKFESFEKMKNQNGILYYVPPWNTSKIDPLTGFVDFLKPKYENLEKSLEFFSKFELIRFNKDYSYFEFKFNYSKFTTKAEGSILAWSICTTNEDRYCWNKKLNNGKGAYEKVLVTQELSKLFSDSNINFKECDNIKDMILEINNVDFFKKLFRLLQTTLTLRHNNGLTGVNEQDYILSPVAPFFDSRKASIELPLDADANGAFHIAKKGLWILHEQINKAENLKDIKTAITNKEWLAYAQSTCLGKK